MTKDHTTEAQRIWAALRPTIDNEIKKRTKSCVRAKKMLVTSAPNGTTVGVTEAGGTQINVPYSSALNLSVGDSVWVWWYSGSASNMIAMAMGDGQLQKT